MRNAVKGYGSKKFFTIEDMADGEISDEDENEDGDASDDGDEDDEDDQFDEEELLIKHQLISSFMNYYRSKE